MFRTAICLLALIGASAALAQSYPDRPIKLIVPWPPGQATDISARIVAQKVSEQIGQPIVVDNRAGAGGIIGTDAVARAAPDGYTLLAASSGPVTINPLLQKVPYDVERQLVPVNLIGLSPYVLVTSPAFPAANAKDLVALIKANPGKYSFSSSGTGATTHLITEWFNSIAQLQVTHVPYKGSTPSLTDVMGGQIAYTIETLASAGTLIKSGKLRAYGISITRRSAVLPDVPPLAEAANMPGFDVAAWIGYMMPAGTPREIVARLSAETEKALQTPEVRERFAAIGMEIDSKRMDEFGTYLKGEQARFGAIITKANIKIE